MKQESQSVTSEESCHATSLSVYGFESVDVRLGRIHLLHVSFHTVKRHHYGGVHHRYAK